MEALVQRFIHNINPEQMFSYDGEDYQYNTTDSEGFTYWKQLGKGNDLGLQLKEVKAMDANYLLVVFHTGEGLVIPRNEHDSPLLNIGV